MSAPAVAAAIGRLGICLRRGDAITVAAGEVLATLDVAGDREGRGRLASLLTMARDDAQDAASAADAAITALATLDEKGVAP